jgi:hypothetical protein
MEEITALRMRIERTESRLRMVVVASVLSVSALGITALARPAVSQQVPQYLTVQHLSAKELHIVDDAGQKRIALYTSTGTAYIEIWAQEGVLGFEANADRGGALVQLHHASGANVTLLTNPAISAVSMRASDERTNAGIGVLFGGPGIFVHDQGRTVFKVP